MSTLVRRSFVGCPAPLAVEVVELARSFPGLGLAVARPSARSFSSWVCVCSFASELAAVRFAACGGGWPVLRAWFLLRRSFYFLGVGGCQFRVCLHLWLCGCVWAGVG